MTLDMMGYMYVHWESKEIIQEMEGYMILGVNDKALRDGGIKEIGSLRNLRNVGI